MGPLFLGTILGTQTLKFSARALIKKEKFLTTSIAEAVLRNNGDDCEFMEMLGQ